MHHLAGKWCHNIESATDMLHDAMQLACFSAQSAHDALCAHSTHQLLCIALQHIMTAPQFNPCTSDTFGCAQNTRNVSCAHSPATYFVHIPPQCMLRTSPYNSSLFSKHTAMQTSEHIAHSISTAHRYHHKMLSAQKPLQYIISTWLTQYTLSTKHTQSIMRHCTAQYYSLCADSASSSRCTVHVAPQYILCPWQT
jgi:hypothetical protein